MAAFTPNSGATVNWDSLAGGSVNATLDTYTISNNTTLLINTDTYQCLNHSTAFGSVDTVSFSGIGGRMLIDGRDVRIIPFDTGTGTVPAIGTSITQGGVSGTLLGVWSGWQTEPLAAAAAMPAAGFIKIKSKAGGNYAVGALGGISASSTGADTTGWIEVRGADTAAITVPRVGKFEVIGDWYEIGVTNGARAQIIPCPTTATSAGTFPGVQIETAAGSGVYEWFPGAGTITGATIRTTGIESKVVWATTTGIRIGNDGTNGVGFLPPTGCKVRIANVILTCCTRTVSGSGPRVLPNVTLGTRQEWTTTGAGSIIMSKVTSNWNNTFAQPFIVTILDSALADTINISEQSAPLDINNITVSPTAAQINFGLVLTSCFGGGNVQNNKFLRISLATSGSYVCSTNFVSGVTFTNNLIIGLTTRANGTTGTWTATQIQACTFNSNVLCGGRFLMTGCGNILFTNTSYIDHFVGTTQATNPMVVLDITGASSIVTMDGVVFPTTNNHPYNAIVNCTASYNIIVKNIGTRASRLNLGSANQTGLIVSSGGNNSNIKIKRVYTINTRTGLQSFVNSDTDILEESVFGDFADNTTFAGLNSVSKGAGKTSATTGQVSVYGTHWLDEFTADTTGRIIALMNEPTTLSVAQSAITVGTPLFNSSGQIAMTIVGQQIVMEMPYFALGHTAAANLAPTLTGTNTGNHTIEFQFDKGAGYNGTWLVASQANWNSVGSITAGLGLRVKLRITCATANAGNLLTQIRFDTISTLSAQTTDVYPISVNTLTLTGLQSGTEVHAYLGTDPATAVEIAGTESSSTSFIITQQYGGSAGYLTLIKYGYKFLQIPLTYASADVSIPIFQTLDRDYANP